MEVEPGRPALVDLDMRFAMADHAAMRLDQAGERKAVRRSSGRGPQHSAVPPEDLGKGSIEPLAQRIAVIGRIGGVRRLHRAPQRGMDRSGIVGEEQHGHILRIMAVDLAVKHQEPIMTEVTISRHGSEQAGEYHAHLPGEAAFGRLTWVRRGTVRVAEHTLVPSEIGGRGVAGSLVEALIADAREQGFKIDPVCSYVAAQFERHPDWANLLAG